MKRFRPFSNSPDFNRKCFNHVHVRTNGVYLIFGVPETSDFTKPPASYEFCGFCLERTRKESRIRFDFGPRPGFSRQLFGSSREGTELDWTCFNSNSSHSNIEIICAYPLRKSQLQLFKGYFVPGVGPAIACGSGCGIRADFWEGDAKGFSGKRGEAIQ